MSPQRLICRRARWAWALTLACVAALGAERNIQFNTDEGTWMSVDISPDGRTLVFDLLGDLYLLPIGGGQARQLTQGPRWDVNPRFSPDGTKILFASDLSGSDQLYTLPASGGDPTAVTSDAGNQYLVPQWDPANNLILALREPLPDAFPIAPVLLHPKGGKGLALELIDAKGGYDVVNSLTASADGRWIYFANRAGITRYDRRSGERTPVIAGYDDVRGPLLSKNQQWLTFTATIDGVPRLMVRDLHRGGDRTLYVGTSRAPLWGSIDLGVVPGYAFTPDDSAIIFVADGKIRRTEVASGQTRIILFTAQVNQTLVERVDAEHKLEDGPFKPKILRWAHRLDKDTLIFSAVGKVHRYAQKTGKTTALVNTPDLQYAPAVSPDGKSVVYLEWNDIAGGRLMRVSATGGKPEALNVRPGRYQSISWSPDGTKLVLAEEILQPDTLTQQGFQFHWVDARKGGELHAITWAPARSERKPIQRPMFDARGERIYFVQKGTAANMGRNSSIELCSVELDGSDRRCLAQFARADEAIPSPDGKWVAFTEMQQVYLAALVPNGGKPLAIDWNNNALPVYKLGPQGDFVYWSNDSRTVLWSWASKVYEADAAAVAAAGMATPRVAEVSFQTPRAIPKGSVLLANARLLTMKGDEVIERGDLLVSDGRIAAIGPSGQVSAPAGTTKMDFSGKTIIPGMIDLHAHYTVGGDQGMGDIHRQQDPSLVASLAYGFTTWRDPSVRSYTLFALAELVEAGATLGPRLHGTGDIFFYSDALCCGQPRDAEDAHRIIRNLKALGATSIKEHTLPRREQVKWVIEASRAEGLQVVEDPMHGPRRELRTIMDGASSLEHAFSGLPMKKDVIEIFKQTGAGWVPTVILSDYENYFMTTTNPHDDAKLRRFTPHARFDKEFHMKNKKLLPEEVAVWEPQAFADFVRGGGLLGLGAHGQLHGLGGHWELWAMASGGLTPMQALHAATINGAHIMGMQKDIGSLEPGKLADLIVLEANPLDDIKNTNTIHSVMKAGVLWNGDTLDEVWPQAKKRPKAGWED